jgi:predicted ATPase
VAEVARSLAFLAELPISSANGRDLATGLVNSVQPSEGSLDAEPIDWHGDDVQPESEAPEQPRLLSIAIQGYRPFERFEAHPGALTVIIGANATGKSSLFDFLRLVRFAASNPLPPEIDPSGAGRMVFHAGGPERISFVLIVDRGQHEPLRYEVEIQGPVGVPTIVRERLATAEPVDKGASEPFTFLDFRGGKGVVRDRVKRTLKRPPWTVSPNELALRRALDPTLVTLSKFQGFLSSWRFYAGFDVSGGASLRGAVPTEPNPILTDDGSNLSAVLFSLMTEHVDAWQELETHLRSAIPGFQSLTVKAHGGPGKIIAVWREQGVKSDLTLADISDGTLRLLCWMTLCLAPSIPPLVCIDEPELGLHPRVLPVLAGLLQMASARSQILVATHSPYLLAQFALSDIAVMRKQDGHAMFVRPDTSAPLRREVEEMGGEAIAQMHISDELEVRI